MEFLQSLLVLQNLLPFKLDNMFSQSAYAAFCCLVIAPALKQLFPKTPDKLGESLNVLFL